MSAEEWERIKSIFEASRLLPPEQRQHYLDEACATCADLKPIVDQLLKNDDEAGEFLQDASLPPTQPVFAHGQVVAGRFHIIRLIAAGGMGEVYEAFDERLRLRIALKTIRSALVAQPEAYVRFKREVSVTREVAHPGICRVFELIEHFDPQRPGSAPVPCLTMKLLEGTDLQAYLRTRRPLPADEVLALLRQICEALQALHEHGIVHRDLKPSNIMLTQGPGGVRVVLTDFGLARRVDQTTVTVGNGGDGQPGAPFFLAPELLKGERESVASDIYSLGLVLDEMVTTSRAFTAESIHALYWQKLWEEPIPPGRRAPALPRGWEPVILRCLAKEPKERYASAIAVVSALEQASVPRKSARAWSPLRFFESPRRKALTLLLTVPLASSLVFLPAMGPTQPMSMMVSPVENRTGRSDLDYVARGTTAELLRRLGSIRSLHVYAVPNEGTRTTPRQGAEYWLRSELAQGSGTFRLVLRVLEQKTGAEVWSTIAERPENDMLALQSAAAEGAARSIEEQLRAASPASRVLDPVLQWFRSPQVALARPATHSSSAFRLYTRAQTLFEERSAETAQVALELYREAVRHDPQFALAYAAMADVQRFLMELSANQETLRSEARANAEQAVTLDPDLPEAWATLGAVMQVEWEWSKSEHAYRRALDLHPRFARARRQFGGLLLQTGKTEEGLQMIREAVEMDPFDYPNHSAYGFALFHAGRTLEAIAQLERLLQVRDMFAAHITLGQAYASLCADPDPAKAGEYEKKALREAALLEAQETRASQGPGDDRRKWSAVVYAVTHVHRGRPEDARKWLEILEQGRKAGRVASVTVAYVHAVLKEQDRALDLLDMAAAYHEKELANIRIAPYFRPMYGSPRFRRLISTMRLPEVNPT